MSHAAPSQPKDAQTGAPDADQPDGGTHAHRPGEPGTTHAARGEGSPELIIGPVSGADAAPMRLVFPLDKERVTIGSGADQDLRLPGLAPHHLLITHDARDEYRVWPAHEVAGGSVTDPPGWILRTGARIVAGDWNLVFHREEWADHGRPYGGRQGGEGSENELQPPRPADRHDGATYAVGSQVRDPSPPPQRQQ